MGIASAGIDQLVNVVDDTSKQALVAVGALEDAALAAGQGALNVGDKSFDAAMVEVENTRSAFIKALREIAKTVVAPIDAIV